MNKKSVLLIYLNFLEENLCFPLLGNLQKTSDSPEGLRYHIETMQKEEILTRNEHKNILPGPRFLWFMNSEGLLDKWMTTKAGALFMAVLGGGRFSGHTVEGIVTFVEEDKVHISWDNEYTPPILNKKTLKKVWPLRRGDRLYLTEYKARLMGWSKFN